MKRSREGSSQTPAKSSTSKRTKSSQACSSCRKHKTRCEVLSSSSIRCHRCEVLGISCSFESNLTGHASRPGSASLSTLTETQKLAESVLSAMSPKEVVPSSSAGAATDQEESNTPWSYVRLPGLTDWIDVALTPLSRPSGCFADQQTAHSVGHLPFDKILSSEQKRYLLTL